MYLVSSMHLIQEAVSNRGFKDAATSTRHLSINLEFVDLSMNCSSTIFTRQAYDLGDPRWTRNRLAGRGFDVSYCGEERGWTVRWSRSQVGAFEGNYQSQMRSDLDEMWSPTNLCTESNNVKVDAKYKSNNFKQVCQSEVRQTDWERIQANKWKFERTEGRQINSTIIYSWVHLKNGSTVDCYCNLFMIQLSIRLPAQNLVRSTVGPTVTLSIQHFGPTLNKCLYDPTFVGQIDWTGRLGRPIGNTGWTDRLDRPVEKTGWEDRRSDWWVVYSFKTRHHYFRGSNT